MVQLEELREQLRRIPGVFLDDRHQYSIRAFMFEKRPHGLLLRLLNSIRSFGVGLGEPTPLPTLVVNHLITDLRLDRLSFHHTMIDTTIVAMDTDKGTGLTALRDRVLGPDAETVAIGDTEADLPMFRAAARSFAPAQISCRRQARLLGCAVSRYRYQRGLLDIVRTLVDCGPGRDPIERANETDGETLFLDLLRAADHPNVRAIVRALFERVVYDTLRMLWRHKLLIAAVLGIALAALSVALALIAPRYTGEAMIQLDFTRNETVAGEKVQSTAAVDAASVVDSAARIIRSRGTASAVVSALGLDNDPAYTRLSLPARALSSVWSVFGL